MSGEVRVAPRRFGSSDLLVALIIFGAVAFILANFVRDLSPDRVNTAAGAQFTCRVLSVFDGDGPITCAEIDQDGQPVQVRLQGIEARELDDTCHQADVCPDASGAAAKGELARLAVGRLRCRSFGPSSFGRVGALCRTSRGIDLSCAMIRNGMALRWPQYDPEGRLRRCHPGRALR